MIDWLFRDRNTGKLVIGQFPNVPLWIFFVGTVLRLLFDPGGTPGDVLRVVTTAALVWWAVDEVARGVNPWRRFLGGVVLLGQVLALLR